MDITATISRIRTALHTTFDEVEGWFASDRDLLNYRPASGGWTVAEILEHIVLTSHFLLILIDKGAAKAMKNIHDLDLEQELQDYQLETEGLDAIGVTKSFEWIRPEHMEPKGDRSLGEVKAELNNQRSRIADHLDSMPNGEGVLFKTTMSVNNLGKIDVYQYIYFLIQHAARHIQQMEGIRQEYLKN